MDPVGDTGRSVAPWSPVEGVSLAEQLELFGTLATSAPVGVIASDLDGVIVWVNPVGAALFGWPREELLGERFTTLLPPEAHSRVLDLGTGILRGEPPTPVLTTGLRHDAEAFDLSVIPGVRRDRQGRPVGTIMILRDVTEEVRAQKEPADALARSRARFDQSANPQALLDPEGRFLEVNDAGCELLGWPRRQLVGRDTTEIIYPRDPEAVRERLTLLRNGKLRAATYETVAIRQDGRSVPLQIDITAVRDSAGRAYEFAVYARDLTELREAQRALVTQEAFHRALNRESSDATLVADTQGRIVYVSPSTTQVLGYLPEEIVDLVGEELAHPDDVAAVVAARHRIRAAPGTRERFNVRVRDRADRWRWFEATATNCVDDPDINGVVVNLREVTAELEAGQALRESEARYRAIAQTAQEGILALSPDGDVLFANDRLSDILGAPPGQIAAMKQQGAQGLRQLLGGGAEAMPAESRMRGSASYDVTYPHPDGSDRTLSVSASPLVADDGRELGWLAMTSDVTAQRAAEANLRHQALHDGLTGLPNRALFLDRLGTAAARQERAGGSGLALLFLDLDDFKRVNDTYGHDVGDRLLTEVARRLAGSVRTTDTVARLGGDEFAVLCEDAGSEAATQVAARIHLALAEPVTLDGHQLTVACSIGVALSPPHPVEDLLRLADRAMYHAKATGSGVTVHDPDR